MRLQWAGAPEDRPHARCECACYNCTPVLLAAPTAQLTAVELASRGAQERHASAGQRCPEAIRHLCRPAARGRRLRLVCSASRRLALSHPLSLLSCRGGQLALRLAIRTPERARRVDIRFLGALRPRRREKVPCPPLDPVTRTVAAVRSAFATWPSGPAAPGWRRTRPKPRSPG